MCTSARTHVCVRNIDADVKSVMDSKSVEKSKSDVVPFDKKFTIMSMCARAEKLNHQDRFYQTS